jgi:uncharacterized protein
MRYFMMGVLVFISTACLASSYSQQHKDAKSYKQQGQYIEAIKIWRQLASQGYADAQFYLGIMYEEGKGVRRSEKQAMHWYKKAADQKSLGALNNYGVLAIGNKRYHEAVNAFQKASMLGSTDAEVNLKQTLSYLQNYQLEVAKNGVKLFQSASKNSAVIKSLRLGEMGYKIQKSGKWVKVSFAGETSVGWVQTKYLSSNQKAYRSASQAYIFKNFKPAFKSMLTLAEKGHVNAQMDLARMYLNGHGTVVNFGKAIYWSNKAKLQMNIGDKRISFAQQTINLAKSAMGHEGVQLAIEQM